MGRREMSAPRRNWLSSLQRQRPREVGGKMDLEAGPRRQSVGRSDGPHADRHLRDHAREEEAALVRSFVDPSAVAAMHYSRRKEGSRIGVKSRAAGRLRQQAAGSQSRVAEGSLPAYNYEEGGRRSVRQEGGRRRGQFWIGRGDWRKCTALHRLVGLAVPLLFLSLARSLAHFLFVWAHASC